MPNSNAFLFKALQAYSRVVVFDLVTLCELETLCYEHDIAFSVKTYSEGGHPYFEIIPCRRELRATDVPVREPDERIQSTVAKVAAATTDRIEATIAGADFSSRGRRMAIQRGDRGAILQFVPVDVARYGCAGGALCSAAASAVWLITGRFEILVIAGAFIGFGLGALYGIRKQRQQQ